MVYFFVFINTTQAGIVGNVLVEDAYVNMARVVLDSSSLKSSFKYRTTIKADALCVLSRPQPVTLHVSLHFLPYCCVFLTLLSNGFHIFFFYKSTSACIGHTVSLQG